MLRSRSRIRPAADIVLGSLGDAPLQLDPLPSPSGTPASAGLVGSIGTSSDNSPGGSSGSVTDDGPVSADGAPASTGGDEETALPDIEKASGTRGGPLVGVGLGGLLLLAALAEGDRRKIPMRRAQRSVPIEVMA